MFTKRILPNQLFATLALVTTASASPLLQGINCPPPTTNTTFATEMHEAASLLTVVFSAPSDGNYTVQDLYQHYATQLAAAGLQFIEGANAMGATLPPNSPFFSTAYVLLNSCGVHLANAGAAIASEKFDIARAEILAFQSAMTQAQLADDELQSLGFGTIAAACNSLANDLSTLGANRTKLASVLEGAVQLGLGGSAALAGQSEWLSHVVDPQLLAMLHVSSLDDQHALVDLPAMLDDESFHEWLEEMQGNTESLMVAVASCAMSTDVYALGEGLEEVGDELDECPFGGTPDCPSECAENSDCGDCEPTEMGLGMAVAAGDINPKEIKTLLKLGAAALAGAPVAEYHQPGPLVGPYTATHHAEGFAGLCAIARMTAEMYPIIYAKIKYHCCVDDTCKDFWGWFPVWTTIDIKVCEEHTSDWVKCEGSQSYWSGLLQGSQRKLKKALKEAGDKAAKKFCKTACDAQ